MAQIRTWKELCEMERIDGKKNISRVAKQIVSICKCIKRQAVASTGRWGELLKKSAEKCQKSGRGLVPKDNLFPHCLS